MKLYYIDKNGWPLEFIKGRPFVNLIRRLLYTRRVTTKRPRCLDAEGRVARARKVAAGIPLPSEALEEPGGYHGRGRH